MTYVETIKIPASKVDKFNELLAKTSEDGLVKALDYPVDEMIECYTAHFSNGWDADIKLCSGDTNFFVDPVLFDENGNEQSVLDCTDEYDGEYIFEVGDDTYEVVVKKVAEPCAFLYTEIQRLDALDNDCFGATKIFKSEGDAYAHMVNRRKELKAHGFEYADAPYRNCYIHKENNLCLVPRVVPITVQ